MNVRLPSWFEQEIPDREIFSLMSSLSGRRVNTICQEAHCPNLTHCFKNKEVTFMILGNTCTRNCQFCAVTKSKNMNLILDEDEPWRIFRVVRDLGLKYVVITSVSRDDLPDGGSGIFAKTMELIYSCNGVKVEVLIPDFSGNSSSLQKVIATGPDIIAHNLETINRLYPELRPQADYRLSLGVLRKIKEFSPRIITKSSLMLGLGEREEEVILTLQDLRGSLCDIVTLGQYLAPSSKHYPVKEFICPEQFSEYKKIALGLGFKTVLSGPKVRSSYKAKETHREFVYA